MKKNYIAIISIVVLFLLSGCSFKKEGEVDYAKTNITLEKKNTEYNKQNLENKLGESRKIYESLYPKYTDIEDIKKGDTISVHLSNVFIEDTPEGKNLNEIFSNQASNAEIAIVAHVCEQGENGCSQEFGEKLEKNGRVIYFSDSVKSKQMLNFSYLPIYGPIKYNGKPLILQFYIIELDISEDQEKNLIKSLASLGKIAYPPASQVLSTLDTLGRTLLVGDQHDIVFRYDLTLVPDTANKNYQYPILSAGNYVFLKKETYIGSQEEEVWERIKLDHLTGKLMQECNSEKDHKDNYSYNKHEKKSFNLCKKPNSSNKQYKEYRENTYMTIQIQTGFEEASLDGLQTLATLKTDLEKAQKAKNTKINGIIQESISSISKDNTSKRFMQYIKKLEEKLAKNSSLKKKDLRKTIVNNFIDEFGILINEYWSCKTTSVEGCNLLPDKNEMNKLVIKTRSLLSLNGKTENQINSILPLDKNITKDFSLAKEALY